MSNAPNLDKVRIDIYTNRRFKVRDYMVTREGNLNVLVTPSYAEADSTVLDWIVCSEVKDDDDSIISVQTISTDKPTMTAVAVCKE